MVLMEPPGVTTDDAVEVWFVPVVVTPVVTTFPFPVTVVAVYPLTETVEPPVWHPPATVQFVVV